MVSGKMYNIKSWRLWAVIITIGLVFVLLATVGIADRNQWNKQTTIEAEKIIQKQNEIEKETKIIQQEYIKNLCFAAGGKLVAKHTCLVKGKLVKYGKN